MRSGGPKGENKHWRMMMKGIHIWMWRINGQQTSDLQVGAAMLRMVDQYPWKRA
jgi:hypothetical protein